MLNYRMVKEGEHTMKKKNVAYVMLCICVAVLVSGCRLEKESEKGMDVTLTPMAMNSLSQVSNKEKPTIVPPEHMEVIIYTLNPNTLKKEAVTVLIQVESELNAEVIVEQVVVAMEDSGFYIGINEISTDGDTVIVDFDSDSAPVCGVGASVEGAILDVIGQSILDNILDCKKIIYHIEGEAYETGHLQFEFDEVYIGR